MVDSRCTTVYKSTVNIGLQVNYSVHMYSVYWTPGDATLHFISTLSNLYWSSFLSIVKVHNDTLYLEYRGCACCQAKIQVKAGKLFLCDFSTEGGNSLQTLRSPLQITIMSQILRHFLTNFNYWVNPSKRGGMNGIFFGLAGMLRGISRGQSPREIPRSSPASPRKTPSILTLLLGFTFYLK